MKILYFDPILGASGDMILAALIDLGVPKDYLKKNLRFLPNFELKVSRVQRHGVSAQHMKFKIKGKIKENRFIPLINKSGLSSSIKATAITIINRIFEVEKKVHRADHLHLHELADADTLLDITGALVAIDYLKVDKIYSKPLKAGKGFIKTVEGNMPAFNFATAELLKDFPVEFLPISAELTTPTGAAIISTVAEPADNLILSKIISVGMGTGTLDIKDYPNLLRVFVGESDEKLNDECTVINTNIDDMNPQDYDLVFEKLYEAGALEVFLTPIIMKHSRPGVLLTVLCQKNKNKILDILFKETTTLGIRVENTKRLKLRRKIIKVKTPYGNIRVKTAEIGNKTRFSLEYQDLKKIAQKNNLSLRELRNELTKFVEKKIFRQTPS
ncbi:nickel pincer cofactor biosynthesis protein LarC [candidate division WOR-3 bacterium]|nr:nickel pincer cofactor biosynthesis protein LarC [candidate division WOR-3 bacterium]